MSEISPENPYRMFTSAEAPAVRFVQSSNVGQVVTAIDGQLSSMHTRDGIIDSSFFSMLHAPSINVEEIMSRREVLKTLVQDVDESMRLTDGVSGSEAYMKTFEFFMSIPVEEKEKAYEINRHKGWLQEDDEGYYVPKNHLEQYVIDGVENGVNEAVAKLADRRKVLESWLQEELAKGPHQFFVDVSAYMQTLYGSVPELDVEALIAEAKGQKRDYMLDHIEKLTPIRTANKHTLGLLTAGNIIREESMCEVEFVDAKQQSGFSEGWNFYKIRDVKNGFSGNAVRKQVDNDSLPDQSVRVLAGANMTGKSFTLEREFAHDEFAQSFGYAPSRESFVRLAPSLIYIDRSSTHATRDLSAFGSEVEAWSRGLEIVEASSKVLTDEPYSTTSPEEQAALLTATARYLGSLGAQFTVATHNEVAVEQFKNWEGGSISHLGFSVVDGLPVYTHKLEVGADDSHALDVATGLGMSEDIRRIAQAYIDGEPAVIDCVDNKHPEVSVLTEAEREKLKLEIGSPELFVPGVDYLHVVEDEDSPWRFRGLLHDGEVNYKAQYVVYGDSEQHYQYDPEAHAKWTNGSLPGSVMYLSDDYEIRSKINHQFGGFALDMLETPNADPSMLSELGKFYDAFSDPDFSRAITSAYDVLTLQLNSLRNLKKVSGTYTGAGVLDKVIEELSSDFIKSFSSDAVDVRIYVEFTEAMLDVFELQPEDIKIKKHLRALKELEEYFVQLGAFETEKGSKLNNSDRMEFKDSIKDGWQDRLLDIERRYGIKTKSSTHVMKDGTSVTFFYTHPREVVKKAVQSIQKKLEKLPKLELFGEGLNPETIEGRRKIDRLKQAREKMFGYMADENMPNMYGVERSAGNLTAVELLIDEDIIGSELVRTLRTNDSVVAHQYANYLENILPTVVAGQLSTVEIFRRLRERDSGGVHGGYRLRDVGIDGMSARNIAHELSRFSDVMYTARAMAREGFKPATYNTANKIQIAQGWNPSVDSKDTSNQVPNSFTIGENERFMMLTGANMSGKTNGLKQLFLTQLFAQKTGMVPAHAASVSVFDRLVYLDRPDSSSQDEGLSAFGTDMKRWITLYEAVASQEQAATAVFADEVFSSTSPLYQESLTYASTVKLIRNGAMGAIATHNHNVVNRLETEFSSVISSSHFETNIDDKGVAQFTYELRPGHDMSKAIAVARAIGGIPLELLDEAEKLLEEQRLN